MTKREKVDDKMRNQTILSIKLKVYRKDIIRKLKFLFSSLGTSIGDKETDMQAGKGVLTRQHTMNKRRRQKGSHII